MCLQVKVQALCTEFSICIDPNTCQDEEDDGSLLVQKKTWVFQAKELKRDFNG
jgi:hypothetical protein